MDKGITATTYGVSLNLQDRGNSLRIRPPPLFRTTVRMKSRQRRMNATPRVSLYKSGYTIFLLANPTLRPSVRTEVPLVIQYRPTTAAI